MIESVIHVLELANYEFMGVGIVRRLPSGTGSLDMFVGTEFHEVRLHFQPHSS